VRMTRLVALVCLRFVVGLVVLRFREGEIAGAEMWHEGLPGDYRCAAAICRTYRYNDLFKLLSRTDASTRQNVGFECLYITLSTTPSVGKRTDKSNISPAFRAQPQGYTCKAWDQRLKILDRSLHEGIRVILYCVYSSRTLFSCASSRFCRREMT
jgi:hypothetical protein